MGATTKKEKLRGKKGVNNKMVNVRGIVKDLSKNGEYDTASVAGNNIPLPLIWKYTIWRGNYCKENWIG